MRMINPLWIVYLAAAGFGAAVVYQIVVNRKAIGDALSSAAESLNPANPDNIVAKEANMIVQTVTGDPQQTVGGAIHDYLNPRAGLAANESSPKPGIIIVDVIKKAPPSSIGDAPDIATERLQQVM